MRPTCCTSDSFWRLTNQTTELPQVAQIGCSAIRAAAGPARRTTSSARSAAFTTPRLSRHLAFENRRRESSPSLSLRYSGVSTTAPGVRQLKRLPLCLTFHAKPRQKMTMLVIAAPMTVSPAVATFAASDAKQTIIQCRFSIMCCSTARTGRIACRTPSRLVAEFVQVGSCKPDGGGDRRQLCEQMSMRPKNEMVPATMGPNCAGSVALQRRYFICVPVWLATSSARAPSLCPAKAQQ